MKAPLMPKSPLPCYIPVLERDTMDKSAVVRVSTSGRTFGML